MRPSETKPQNRVGYNVPKQPDGTRVSYWADPRGPNHGVVRLGTIVSHTGETVLIVWDDDDECYERWPSSEIRYRIERGQLNLKRPPKERRMRIAKNLLVCKQCGELRSSGCGCIREGALKPEHWGQKVVPERLTSLPSDDMMVISNEGNALTMMMKRKGHMMATKKAAKVLEAIDEIEELEELDTTEAEGTDDEVEAGTEKLTAKQAATLLKTDGRTLRKFLRKEHGVIGQGQRWEIDPDDIPALKEKFESFSKGARTEPKAPKAAAPAKPKKSKVDPDDSLYGPEPDDETILGEADLDDFEEIDDLDFG